MGYGIEGRGREVKVFFPFPVRGNTFTSAAQLGSGRAGFIAQDFLSGALLPPSDDTNHREQGSWQVVGACPGVAQC